MGIIALASANSNSKFSWRSNRNSVKNSLKPTDWLSPSELESLPSMHELSLKNLEEMSMEEGAELFNKMYHLAQAGQAIEPSHVLKPSEIPAYLITPNNKKVTFKLNQLPKMAREEKSFGEQEVTIFITGLPEKTESIKKAYRKLVQSYMQRYNGQRQKYQNIRYEDDSDDKDSDEESWNNNSNNPSGNLVVIELGKAINNIQELMSLDVEKTGEEIGNVLVELVDKADVPQEIIHVIATNIAAHVAGAAGRQFRQETGHQLRRITGLDPSKVFAQTEKTLRGLARGDADFVDAIHTSAYGLGTPTRCGDVDFYPNGPSAGVPGADNIVEASMRAIRYFAESAVPGNERNFPAVSATSLEQYKEQDGNGKRVYMGVATDYDVEGDFVLQVNAKSPFGRMAPAQKQKNYHNNHKSWKMSSRDY